MPGIALRLLPIVGVAGLLLTGGAGGLLAQERVGVTSAVNTEATGALPGAAARRLVIGQDVIFNEHITTTASGQSQLLFLDESSMTVGPNSDLTIDRFVFDPKSGTGKLAMSATRGLLRYVGGKLSKQDEAVTLRTATATLAVRGGAFIVRIGPGGSMDATFLYGKGLTVTGLAGVPQTITRPGFMVSVSGPGAAPSRPAPAPPGQLALATQQLDGQTGGRGGASVIPTDTTVADSGVSQTISGNVTQSLQQTAQNTPASPSTAPSTTNFSPGPTTVNTLQSTTAQPAGSQVAMGQPPTSIPVPTIPPPPPLVMIQIAGAVKSTGNSAPGLGFTDPSKYVPYANGNIIYPPGTPLQNGVATATAGTQSFALAPLTPGTTTTVGATCTGCNGGAGGTAAGTAVTDADSSFFYANLISTKDSSPVFVFGGTPVSPSFFAPIPTQQFLSFNVNPDISLASGSQAQTIPFLPPGFGGTMANATVSPLLVATSANEQFGVSNNVTHNDGLAPKWLQASLTLNGQGASQTAALVSTIGSFSTSSDNGQVIASGNIRGAVNLNATSPIVGIYASVHSVPDGNGNSLFGSNAISGFVLDQNDNNITGNFQPNLASAAQFGQTTVDYAFNQPVTSGGNFTPGTRSALAETGFFGGIMTHTTNPTTGSPYVLSGNTMVQTDPASNRVAATFGGTDPFTSAQSGIRSMVLNFGSLPTQITSNYSRSAFIDNNNYAAHESPVTPSQINGTNLPTVTTAANPTVLGPGAQPPGSSLPNLTPSLAMVTSATVPVTLFGVGPSSGLAPPMLIPVTPCACQYLQWGYWTGQVLTPNSTLTASTRDDRAFINTWLAGTPTVNLPTTGTGTYNGAAVGTVFNAGATYLAAGAFNGTYNFGTQSGTMSINNFDGHSFSATGRAPLTGANYTFNVAQPGVAGTINGAFYGPNAVETGGNFAFHTTAGPAYLASGIFAGK